MNLLPSGYPPESVNVEMLDDPALDTNNVEFWSFQRRMENITILDPNDNKPGVKQRQITGTRDLTAYFQQGKPMIFMDREEKTFHHEDGSEVPFDDLPKSVQDQAASFQKKEDERAKLWKDYYDRVGYPAFPTEVQNPGHYHVPTEKKDDLMEETKSDPPPPLETDVPKEQSAEPLHCPICAFKGQARTYQDQDTFMAHMESHKGGK